MRILQFTFESLAIIALAFSPVHLYSEASPSEPLLHPKAEKLLILEQGPFVANADGSVLFVNSSRAFRTTDDGKSYKITPVFRDLKKYTMRNERALLRTHSGVVIAAWLNGFETKSPKDMKWGGKGMDFKEWVLPTYVCRSLDGGATWEEPILASGGWCGCVHSMIETSKGRIVLVGQEIIPEWRHATVVFFSDDNGKTWRRGGTIDYGIGNSDHSGSIEGTVIELRDGSLYMLLRTETGFLWEATSIDDGLTWCDVKQSQIRSVTCCAQMLRLKDGRIALLWNHPPRHKTDSGTSREELSLAFSSDECATWSKPMVVAASYDPGESPGKKAPPWVHQVAYPYLFERKPGELWITTMYGGVRMKINVADLPQGEIPIYKQLKETE